LAFEQECVIFRWKDYAHAGKQGQMKLAATEFLRRFFLHVLKGFVRIRHFGFLAHRFRVSRLTLAQQLLASSCSMPEDGSALWHRPRCGATMILIQRFTTAQLSTCIYLDSS